MVAGSWFVLAPSLSPDRYGQIGTLTFCIQNIVAIYALTLLMLVPYLKYFAHHNLQLTASSFQLNNILLVLRGVLAVLRKLFLVSVCY